MDNFNKKSDVSFKPQWREWRHFTNLLLPGLWFGSVEEYGSIMNHYADSLTLQTDFSWWFSFETVWVWDKTVRTVSGLPLEFFWHGWLEVVRSETQRIKLSYIMLTHFHVLHKLVTFASTINVRCVCFFLFMYMLWNYR